MTIKYNFFYQCQVYKPCLWYYEHLTFLDSFFIARKSRNSLEKNKRDKNETLENLVCSQEFQIQDNFFSQDSIHVVADKISEDGHLKVFIEEKLNNESDESRAFSEVSEMPSALKEYAVVPSTSIQPPTYSLSKVSPGSVCPSPSISPAMSSSLRMSTERPLPSHSNAQKKRKTTSGDPYSEAVQSLADSLRQPIMVAKSNSSSDTVDGFLMFLGSMLRNFQNENLRLDVMNT